MAHVTFWTAKHGSNNQLNKTLIRAVPQCIIDNIYDNTKPMNDISTYQILKWIILNKTSLQ